MSPTERLFSGQNRPQDHKPFIEILEGYQKLKEYHKALDQLNAHSAQLGEILRAMEDEEPRTTND